MLPGPGKHQLMIRGVTASAGGTQIIGYADLKGFDVCEIDVFLTTSDDTTNNPTMFKLGDASVTNVTSATDITAFVGDGTGGWTIPAAHTATTTNDVYKFHVDCRGLDRYLHLEIMPLLNASCWAFANLYRAEQGVDSSTDANTVALVAGP